MEMIIEYPGVDSTVETALIRHFGIDSIVETALIRCAGFDTDKAGEGSFLLFLN